jgi:hypothetical protein
MQQFIGHKFFHWSKILGRLHEVSSTRSSTAGPMAPHCHKQLQRLTRELMECCQTIELEMACKMIARIQNVLDDSCNHMTAVSMLDNLAHIIYDQLEMTLFFHVDGNKADFYREPWKAFGLEDFDRLSKLTKDFASLSQDIEESGKCLALRRNTAAVFHLMRVMESGLHIIADKLIELGLNPPLPEHNPTWESILKVIDGEIKKPGNLKSPEWRKLEGDYAELAAHVRSVKVAWRNPTMHVENFYTDERAEDIFRSVCGFMRHLAMKFDKDKTS